MLQCAGHLAWTCEPHRPQSGAGTRGKLAWGLVASQQAAACARTGAQEAAATGSQAGSGP